METLAIAFGCMGVGCLIVTIRYRAEARLDRRVSLSRYKACLELLKHARDLAGRHDHEIALVVARKVEKQVGARIARLERELARLSQDHPYFDDADIELKLLDSNAIDMLREGCDGQRNGC
jgi:hypothetical protein